MTDPVIWTLEIPGWTPTPLNQLLGNHFKAGRLKGKDRLMVETAVLGYGVPPAQGRRRVSLHVVWPKGTRSTDPDSLWKSLLDALVHAEALVNDSAQWVEIGTPVYSRGDRLVSFITIQEAP